MAWAKSICKATLMSSASASTVASGPTSFSPGLSVPWLLPTSWVMMTYHDNHIAYWLYNGGPIPGGRTFTDQDVAAVEELRGRLSQEKIDESLILLHEGWQ